MIEVNCQNCGETAGVQSFLAAAQQTCRRCGRLLMGSLSAGGRTVRPAGFDGQLPSAEAGYGSGSSAGMWLGTLAGAFAGVALVAALAHLEREIPFHVRAIVLGALMGVLLGPILAVGSFISMLIFPFGLEAVFGDAVWTRLARANNERSLRPLFVPFLLCVVGPMALGGWCGTNLKAIGPPIVFWAGAGAFLLGALVGSICGSFLGGRRQPG